MGDLYEIYSIANLAIVGGSILDYGGQNPIEPMSLGIQTAVGPSIYNFKDWSYTSDPSNLSAKTLTGPWFINAFDSPPIKFCIPPTSGGKFLVAMTNII